VMSREGFLRTSDVRRFGMIEADEAERTLGRLWFSQVFATANKPASLDISML